MKIYFLNGPRKGETMEMVPPVLTVGRETDNTLGLLVGGVSRYHAKFEQNGSSWILSDLGSTNGTKVNGIKILAPQELKPGDMIYFGDQHIKVFENSPDEGAPTSSKIQTSIPQPEQPQEIKITPPETSANLLIKEPEPLDENSIFRREPEPISPTARTIPDINDFKSQTPQTPEIGAFSKMNFFGKKETSKEENGDGKPKRKHANLLFYVLVIGLAVIFISTYFTFEKISAEKAALAAKKKEKTETKKSNFILYYSKQIIKNNNIFYFNLSIEKGNVTFTVDDLKTNVHYMKNIEDADNSNLSDLEQTVKGTSFMALKPDNSPPPPKPESIRSLTISYDGNLNEITVRDNFALSSFETIEAAIDEFAAHYDLRASSLTPEELKLEAEKAFLKAEELYANLEARPENLREAIARYKLTVEYLAPFSPKPVMWNDARKKLQAADAIQKKRIKDIEFDFHQALKMKDIPRATEMATQMLKTADQNSKIYNTYKTRKISLESEMRSHKKK